MKSIELVLKMILQQLFEADMYSEVGPRSTAYKELANRFDLTMSSGKGLPAVGKSSVRFAYGLKPKGGDTGETKAGEDRLPYKLRLKGFLNELVKLLKDELAEGRGVDILFGGAAKAKHPVDADTIKDIVHQATMNAIVPGGAYSSSAPLAYADCIGWVINFPEDAK
jgi:hypothetical protein